ncbi:MULTISPECIES: VanW family protein [unclassified Romboutsia]|uniref:VanW family protein n=1 Tax=unclassified Romboutsia TaxID=2626894 RepID=UPI0008215138|nr:MULTISPECIES: VanW family protein [unclassified Romboutsia]SCG98514.1 Uncharacterized vancomycin resistance protein [uncultured Clostridium sp.]
MDKDQNNINNSHKDEVEKLNEEKDVVDAEDITINYENEEVKPEDEKFNKEGSEEIKEELEEESKKEEVKENNDCKQMKFKFDKKSKIISAACVGVIIVGSIIASNVTSKYKALVFPGTKLYEVNISKLDKDNLNEKVSNIKNEIGSNKIKIKAKNDTYNLEFKDLIKTYNEDKLENEVMSYGKDGNTLQQFGMIIIGIAKNYEFDIKVNENKLNELVNKIYDENSKAPEEPKISINGDDIEITEGKKGNVVDKESLVATLKNMIENYDGNNEAKNIEVSYIEEDPKISVDDLNKVNTKISSYSTTYGTGGGRGKNIEVATNKVDDLLLMPGEEFSYEATVGPVETSNGYTYAPVISNGTLTQGVGGGVCQVSTTIYNAQLRAGILPTERRNHSKAVSYVPRGMDATLASGSIDYKFKNTYDYPLVINTYTSGGTIHIEFWSNKDATNGLTYEAVSYASGNVANTYLYGYDSNNNKVYEKHVDTSVYR